MFFSVANCSWRRQSWDLRVNNFIWMKESAGQSTEIIYTIEIKSMAVASIYFLGLVFNWKDFDTWDRISYALLSQARDRPEVLPVSVNCWPLAGLYSGSAKWEINISLSLFHRNLNLNFSKQVHLPTRLAIRELTFKKMLCTFPQSTPHSSELDEYRSFLKQIDEMRE